MSKLGSTLLVGTALGTLLQCMCNPLHARAHTIPLLCPCRHPLHALPCARFLFWQTLAFIVLGYSIMRLMLFFTPSFGIVATTLTSPQAWRSWRDAVVGQDSARKAFPAPATKSNRSLTSPSATSRPRLRVLYLVLVASMLAVATWRGVPVLKHKVNSTMNSGNSFSEPTASEANTLELMKWINTHTPKHAVIVSSLALSSTVRIMTGRRLAIHPHAEDAHMRKRYRSMYTVRFVQQLCAVGSSEGEIAGLLVPCRVFSLLHPAAWCADV